MVRGETEIQDHCTERLATVDRVEELPPHLDR